jgi:hypothetical protein
MNWRDQNYCGDEYPTRAMQERLESDFLSVCQNGNCDHPFCPEDSEVNLWEGVTTEVYPTSAT